MARRRSFLRTRVLYYSNTTASFAFRRILLSGDVELNPGMSNLSKFKNKSKSTRHNEVHISHLNIRSLKCREHYLLLRDLISTKDFDIFTISESWLDHNVTDAEIQIPGYNIFRVDRTHKSGGGVCAYVKQQFKVERMVNLSGIFPSGLHQLWLKIQIRNLRSFIICTVYRLPDSSLALTFETELSNSLITGLSFNKPIFILGDLNCNLLDEVNPGALALETFCSSFNLKQLISQPTRITQSSR